MLVSARSQSASLSLSRSVGRSGASYRIECCCYVNYEQAMIKYDGSLEHLDTPQHLCCCRRRIRQEYGDLGARSNMQENSDETKQDEAELYRVTSRKLSPYTMIDLPRRVSTVAHSCDSILQKLLFGVLRKRPRVVADTQRPLKSLESIGVDRYIRKR